MAIKLFKEMSKEEDIHIMELPIDEIKPNPYQQRKYFDFYSLNRLTDSIKKYGVIQPVTVRIVNGSFEPDFRVDTHGVRAGAPGERVIDFI